MKYPGAKTGSKIDEEMKTVEGPNFDMFLKCCLVQIGLVFELGGEVFGEISLN